MSSNPFAAYQETRVLTASPLQLVHLAYEGAIDAIKDARRYLAEKNINERSRAITKAQKIITELQTTLDFQRGQDLSTQLSRLYDYMQSQLREANFKQSEAPLADVQNLLETIDEAWRELASSETTVIAAAASSSSRWMTTDTPAYSRTDFTL